MSAFAGSSPKSSSAGVQTISWAYEYWLETPPKGPLPMTARHRRNILHSATRWTDVLPEPFFLSIESFAPNRAGAGTRRVREDDAMLAAECMGVVQDGPAVVLPGADPADHTRHSGRADRALVLNLANFVLVKARLKLIVAVNIMSAEAHDFAGQPDPDTPPKRHEQRLSARRAAAPRAIIPVLLAGQLLTGPDADAARALQPVTEPVGDSQIAQVINWVVQKSGCAMADGTAQNTAADAAAVAPSPVRASAAVSI
ncbi:hypothetical protein AURDEDRAFT_120896 [Auricularia subglabra TFB-10046 SS5]|nr:hypothetical protein AURDEDRAFT_120896 [Auricularia subglabra TFB-10046 SS5]